MTSIPASQAAMIQPKTLPEVPSSSRVMASPNSTPAI